MTSLEDLQLKFREVTVEKLKPGVLLITTLTPQDGLILKNNKKFRKKRIVVVGVDKNTEKIYGSVLVNTHLSLLSEYSSEHLSAQYELSAENYPSFLEYNSYVDCGELFEIDVDKLLTGEYHGELTESDKDAIWEILETTDTLTTKQKKKYNIKRR